MARPMRPAAPISGSFTRALAQQIQLLEGFAQELAVGVGHLAQGQAVHSGAQAGHFHGGLDEDGLVSRKSRVNSR